MRLLARLLAVVGVLFCAVNLHAQTQGLLPTVIDSLNIGANNASCGLNCIIMADGATSGKLIVVAAVQPDTGGGACTNSNPPWVVTDSIGNTYTAESSSVTPTGGVSPNDYVQMFHTVSGSTAANQISINWGAADCGGQIYIAQFDNISGTTDGLSTATGGPGATPVTATTNNTTTVNGDLLVTFAAVNSGPQGFILGSAPLQYLGTKATVLPEVNAYMGFANATLAGSQALSTVRYAGNTAGSSVMQTLAFKPSAITIVDTALPRGALLNAYSATIHGVGGAGAYACSITAGTLQTGLSLGGTGNCTISGTPSAANTQSITFQITDTGAVHTTTKTLSLTVDTSFNTPFAANTATGTFNNGGGTINIAVNCGDVIVMQLAVGAETHGSTGWIQARNGANSSYFDSMGLPFTPVPGIGGIISGGLQTYLIGPALVAGVDTVTGRNAAGNSAALVVQLTAVRGVQAIADYGSFNNNVTTAGGTNTLTTTYVAPVANELLESMTKDDNPGSSISLGAPFSSLTTGNDGFNEYNFGLATGQTGSVSNAAAITTGGAFRSQSTQLIGLRPGALPAGCPTPLPISGEKIRRQVF